MTKPNRVRYSGYALFVGEKQIKRAQSLTTSTDYDQEKLLELANKGHTEVTDESSTTATIECNDYGGTDNFAAMMGQGIVDPSGRTNDYRLGDNTRSGAPVDVTDIFDDAVADITAKISTDGSSIDRSIWIGRAALTSISMSYSVDGVATESYDFEGDFKRWFLNGSNDYANINVYKADYSDSTTAIVSGSYPTGGGPGDISSTGTNETPLMLLVNNEIAYDVPKDSDTLNISYASGNNEITGDVADLEDGDTISLVTASSSDSFPELPSTPDGLGGLRKDMVDVYLWDPDATEDIVLRAQSVDISIDLSRETKDELGSNKPYYRSLTRPIDVSATLELAASDLEMYAKLSSNQSSFSNSSLDYIDMDDFTRDNRLIIKLYDDETTHDSDSILKMIEIDNLSVSSAEESISVGEDGSVSVDLSADNFLISGSGETPFIADQT